MRKLVSKVQICYMIHIPILFSNRNSGLPLQNQITAANSIHVPLLESLCMLPEWLLLKDNAYLYVQTGFLIASLTHYSTCYMFHWCLKFASLAIFFFHFNGHIDSYKYAKPQKLIQRRHTWTFTCAESVDHSNFFLKADIEDQYMHLDSTFDALSNGTNFKFQFHR